MNSCSQCRSRMHAFQDVDVAVEFLSFEAYGNSDQAVAVKPIKTTSRKLTRKSSIFSAWNIIPVAVAASVLVCLGIIAFPSPKPVNANPISPKQIAEPIHDLHFINSQQQKDQELMLRTLGMDLRAMKLEINQLESGSQEREILEGQIEAMLEKVRLFGQSNDE